MKLPTLLSTFFLALLSLASTTQGFAIHGAATGGSSFVVSSHASAAMAAPTSSRKHNQMSMMGGNQSKFGVFSPAVYAAKIVLGGDKLNKIRGKAISLHSEQISKFCEFFGAYHLRTKLIKKAKVNGDTLGFLV